MEPITLTDYRLLPDLTVDYLIHKLIPKPGRVMLVGPAKAGKSYLALQVALAVAQGRTFMGRTSKPGRVLYLQFDTPDHIWRERMDELEEAGVDLSGEIYFVRPDTAMRQVDIRLESTRKRIENIVAKVKPDLVIVDVLRKIHNAEENDSTEMKKVFDIINVIFSEVAVMLLHHTFKLSGEFTPTPSNAGRGSSFMGGEVDATWLLIANKDGTGRFMIESRVDESVDTLVQRDPETGLWLFTEEAELRDLSDKLIALCDEFPGQTHNQLAAIVKQRYQLSKAQYYRKMKGLRCRHSPKLISASSWRDDNVAEQLALLFSDDEQSHQTIIPQTNALQPYHAPVVTA